MQKLNLTSCQKNALKKLINKTKDLFELEHSFNSKDKDINFQAPTGSGKTFIIANYCSEVIEQFGNKYNLYFIFATVSTGELQLQNYDKLEKYRNFNNLKYRTDKIESPSNKKKTNNKDIKINIKKSRNTVYCIGTSSCTKSSILYNNGKGKLLEFLQDIKNTQNSKLIYIRDEAHIGVDSVSASSKNLDNLVKNYSDLNIYLSATLDKVKKSAEPKRIDIEIKLTDAVQDHLIKSVLKQNDIDEKEDNEFNQQQFIDIALNKFVEIKRLYQSSQNTTIKGINPALLIQIPSSNQNSKQDVYNLLKNMGLFTKILERNLNYVYYTSDLFETNLKFFPKKFNKESKELVTRNDSVIDVIIFKVALATGWDIPRACMLLQLRDIDSESLNIQTIGRIRRNPLQQLDPNNNEKLYHEELIDQYWIYSDNKNAFDKINAINNILYLKPKYTQNKDKFQKIKCIPKLRKDVNEESYINLIYGYLNSKNNPSQSLERYINTLISRLQKNDYKERCRVIISDKYLNKEQDTLNNETSTNNNSYSMFKAVLNIFQLNELFNEKIDDKNLQNYIYKAFLKCLQQQDSLINERINSSSQLKIALNINYCLLNLLDVKNQDLLKEIKILVSNDQFDDYEYILSDEELYLPDWTTQETRSGIKEEFDNDDEDDVKITKYLYSNINKNKANLNNDSIETELYFDSENERQFFKKINKDFIRKIEDKDELKNFKFYTKNYIENSEVCFQYKLKEDGSFRIAETYPDFIIKYKDISFFLEVKDKDASQDFDINKTKSLIEAYNEFNNLQNKAFYSVVKFDKKGNIYSFNNTLPNNNETNNPKPVLLIDFLNETISEMNKRNI